MPDIKVILFDADGVLLNGDTFFANLEEKYAITYEQTLPYYNEKFLQCLTGEMDLLESLPPYLKSWGWKKSPQEFLDEWFEFEHKIDEELVEYVQQLRKRGVLCVIATNQEKRRARYMLEKMNFAQSFDALYASSHLGHKKPAKDFL